MDLAARMEIGPYLILSPLGAGGMGEVYKARDTRLNREVALKILPADMAAHPEHLQRFEREARTVSSLSHPNVLAIFDVGRSGGVPYLVSELLDGQPLADRLKDGPLAPRRAADLALQMAQGLGAVHAKGIVHRDLKPDNVFVTRDGRVKLLDFGLAKPAPLGSLTLEGATAAPTGGASLTETGVVMGTVAYMSPEQIRGGDVDPRSDLFAFGVVLFEMLAGRRPFAGPSAVETMTAILKEDPAPLTSPKGPLPPGLERVVLRCLEKDPARRYASAEDVAFDLDLLSRSSGSGIDLTFPALSARFRAGARTAALVALSGGALAGAYFWGRGTGAAPPPVFERVTFRKGGVQAARFAAGSGDILFAASWNGEPLQLYAGRKGSPEARPLGLPQAGLLGLSRRGDLAVLLRPQTQGWITVGTLARVPLAGGAPRELLDHVQAADWDPSGEQLAVVRYEQGMSRLEYPPGQIRAQTGGWFSHLRFDPEGRRLAYIEHPLGHDDRGHVVLLEVDGSGSRALTGDYSSLQGLAWGPRGELWFSAADGGVERMLKAVDLKGRERPLLVVPGGLELLDVGPGGEALVAHTNARSGILFQGPGDAGPRELSWLNWSLLHGLSADGRWIVFDEEAQAPGPDYGIYLRGTDGSEAVRLGDGVVPALSPDRKWVLAGHHAPEPRLMLLPVGAGTARTLPLQGLQAFFRILWLPDGRFLLFASENGRGAGLYLQGLEDRTLNRLRGPSPDLERGGLLSPDGRWLSIYEDGHPVVLDLTHPEAPGRPIPGLAPSEFPVQWTPDPAWIYVTSSGRLPQALVRLRLADGRREPDRQLGVVGGVAGSTRQVALTPDGKAMAYTYLQMSEDVYRVQGLR